MKIKQRRKKGIFIAGLLVCIAIICGAIGLWNTFYGNVAKANNDDWEHIDLSNVKEPINHTSYTGENITTARATFYDYYSDSQISSTSTNVGSITDGGEKQSSTFKKFDYMLKSYQNYANEVKYPLYVGVFYAGQNNGQRWLNGTSEGYNFHLAANSNQGANAATQGLVNNQLDEDGNMTIGDNKMVLPLFDANFLNQQYKGTGTKLGKVASNLGFPFRKESDGYYYFDCKNDVVTFGEGLNTTNPLQYYKDGWQIYSVNNKINFFPLNYSGASDTAGGGSGKATKLNYGFGMKLEFQFNMTADGKIKGKDIVFEFNGDDDVWIFVDNYLVLDIGGAHTAVTGKINFNSREAIVDRVKNAGAFGTEGGYGSVTTNKTFSFGKNATTVEGKKLNELLNDTNKVHTLTMFYMERGMLDSNLYIKFNLPQITTMSVGNEIDTTQVNASLKTENFWKSCNSHYFKYQLQNKGTEPKDINNPLDFTGQTVTANVRGNLSAIGLTDKLRKKITSTDGQAVRYRFYTFTGKNYYTMVIPRTSVSLETATLPAKGDIQTINGKDYVFLGWTKDKDYYNHWDEIQAGTYTGELPQLETIQNIVAKDSEDYYAVWAHRWVTITYYDQPKIDTPSYGYKANETKIGEAVIDIAQAAELSFVLPTDNTDIVEAWEDKDEHRKGYRLLGWQLEQEDPENDAEVPFYTSFDSPPLCDLQLYAKWEKTHARCIFKMDQNVEKVRGQDKQDTTVSEKKWESNIVYFEIGSKVRLPYLDDTYQTEDLSNMFTTLPIRDCYGITKWTTVIPEGVDEDPKTYQSGNDGNRWTVPKTDTTFTGTWKKVYSNITFDANSTVGNNTKTWDTKTVRHKVGEIIYSKPEAAALWSADDNNGIPSIKLYELTSWKEGDTTIAFPYKVTDEDKVWKAKWSKAYCVTTYQFNTNANIDCGSRTSCEKYFAVNRKMQIPKLEDFGNEAPQDKNGTENGITHYMTGKDGKAYIIDGWSYDKEGNNKVTASDIVQDATVYANWKEVKSSVILHVTVPQEDSEEWDSSIASQKGWTSVNAGNGAKEWRISLDCTPGKSYEDYIHRSNGSRKEILEGVDIEDENAVFRDRKDISGWASSNGGTQNMISDKITYTSDTHSIHLYGIWTKKKNTVYFENCKPGDVSQVLWKGVLTYPINKKTLSKDEMPKINDKIYNSETKELITFTKQEGYELQGWTVNQSDVLEDWNIQDGTILYPLWQSKEEDAPAPTSVQSDGSTTKTRSAKKSSGLKLFSVFSGGSSYSNVSETWYQIGDDHYSTEGKKGVGKTDINGCFYLQYDQVASFFNCFSPKSYMKLKEDIMLYQKNGTGYTADTERLYDSMYSTTWELRDLHNFITNRAKPGSENLEKMTDSRVDNDGIYIYDGRSKEGSDDKTAFQFQNENEATGATYSTNVRAIFTHAVKTGEISITKDMTALGKEVMDARKDKQKEFAFYVYFYNLFGGSGDASTDEAKILYTGTYTKLDADGKVIRDADGKAILFTADKGKILLKAGETATITGIPVFTKYQIKEQNLKLSRRSYVMSEAEEVVTRGLGSDNTKYIVKSKVEATNTKEEDGTSILVSHRTYAQDSVDQIVEEDSARTITGQITKAGQTYNYIVTNDADLEGVQLTIEKLIDRFYYDPEEEFLAGETYQQLTKAKQSFIFEIKYNEVTRDDATGKDTVSNEQKLIQQVISFHPDDTEMKDVRLKCNNKKGWKKSIAVIDLKPGYYEVAEDTGWSWKYDLRRIDLADSVVMRTAKNIFSDSGSGKICRFYVPPVTDVPLDQIGTTTEWKGQQYIILKSNPVITFENTITTDGREEIKGDTDVAVNKLYKPTPEPTATPEPVDNYVSIEMGAIKLNAMESTLRTGETYQLPTVYGIKADGTKEVLDNVTWSSSNSAICQINSNGTGTFAAKAYGTATLTVTYEDIVTKKHTASTSVTPHNMVTVYYKSGWSQAYIKYKLNGETVWTGNTANPMIKTSEKSGYQWKFIIDLVDKTNVDVCFTNGSGDWDSRNEKNYQISKGIVGIHDQEIVENP